MNQDELVRLIVGFDQREAVAYHTFCQSVLEKTSIPVCFLPLAENSLYDYRETHKDGSNSFIYSRFLTPHLMSYQGWAIFADGDMICNADIKELWRLRDETKAVMVVKHDYKTKAHQKYFGNKNENYPRKNWSSVILWNCGHPANSVLTPALIESQPGSYLHRFSWLDDDLVGSLPKKWNWLATEYKDDPEAKIIHFTLGTPCLSDFKNAAMAKFWHDAYERLCQGVDA